MHHFSPVNSGLCALGERKHEFSQVSCTLTSQIQPSGDSHLHHQVISLVLLILFEIASRIVKANLKLTM